MRRRSRKTGTSARHRLIFRTSSSGFLSGAAIRPISAAVAAARSPGSMRMVFRPQASTPREGLLDGSAPAASRPQVCAGGTTRTARHRHVRQRAVQGSLRSLLLHRCDEPMHRWRHRSGRKLRFAACCSNFRDARNPVSRACSYSRNCGSAKFRLRTFIRALLRACGVTLTPTSLSMSPIMTLDGMSAHLIMPRLLIISCRGCDLLRDLSYRV